MAAFDFFLFDYLKRELRGFRFQTTEELLAELRKLAGEFSPETFPDVFHYWIARCEIVIACDGNHSK
jgi:hypothetical protein